MNSIATYFHLSAYPTGISVRMYLNCSVDIHMYQAITDANAYGYYIETLVMALCL